MLTPKQQAVLDYVHAHRAQHGHFPTLREIQAHFGFASPFAATRHLQALAQKGALQRHPGKARAFILPPASAEPTPAFPLRRIPIFGVIPAGLPAANPELSGADADETLALDPCTLGLRPADRRPLFGLRVRGDSMIGAHILEDDIVFLTPGEPRSGQIVAALIDGESTLKRFLLKDGQPVLRAENPRYPDLLPAEELLIQGLMVALLRRPPLPH